MFAYVLNQYISLTSDDGDTCFDLYRGFIYLMLECSNLCIQVTIKSVN